MEPQKSKEGSGRQKALTLLREHMESFTLPELWDLLIAHGVVTREEERVAFQSAPVGMEQTDWVRTREILKKQNRLEDEKWAFVCSQIPVYQEIIDIMIEQDCVGATARRIQRERSAAALRGGHDILRATEDDVEAVPGKHITAVRRWSASRVHDIGRRYGRRGGAGAMGA